MSISVIIVDDEPRAHKVLEFYIAQFPELELRGSFLNADQARRYLLNEMVDLMLLDITMPVVDGFTFLRSLVRPPLIVFTTAHTKFALDSYECDAVDYLLKPISMQRFRKAVGKVRSRLGEQTSSGVQDGFVSLKVDGDVKKIQFSAIQFIQSLGNYVKVVTPGKIHITQTTTKEIEKALPRRIFIRIHKSFIVNKSKITGATDKEIIVDAIHLPVGRTYRKYVKESVY
jgi:two-component system, LytTR family, response regulator